MTRRPFLTTSANSFLAQPVGSTFAALDLAGKAERAEMYGAFYTRVFSGTWAMLAYREDPADGPEGHVNGDLYFFTLANSGFFITGKLVPPRRLHRLPHVPPELEALRAATLVSSSSTPTAF